MARLGLSPPNFADCLKIGEAAEVLGVSTATLRNWDRSGKLKPRRHPQNGYRIYLHEDLDAVLRSAELATQVDKSLIPQIDWSAAAEGEHFVQFYEHSASLIDVASGFIGTALERGDIGVVALTREHRLDLVRKLEARGIDVVAAEDDRRLVLHDAASVLSEIMVNGELDREQFTRMVARVMGDLLERGRRIYAFGEVASLLWSEGRRADAIELEQFWNEYAQRNGLVISCAYPISKFSAGNPQAELAELCTCHSRVIPAESYTMAGDENDRLNSITLLQQKAHALETEILHRQEVEKALCDAHRRKDELIATLSHDLRNPLAPIRNALDLLERDAADEGSRAAAASIIRRQVDQLARLAEDLTDLGRGVSDAKELCHESAELHERPVNPQSDGKSKAAESVATRFNAHLAKGTLKGSTTDAKQAVDKRCILIVDDNIDAGDTLALLLKLKGHEVHIARDGLQAVDMASEIRPDVILMDVGMPNLNGYDATRRIREMPNGRNVFIVALTGWSQPSDVAKSLEAGCSAHLTKPVDFAALDRLLSRRPNAN